MLAGSATKKEQVTHTSENERNQHESALRNVKNDDSHTFMDLAEQVHRIEEYN